MSQRGDGTPYGVVLVRGWYELVGFGKSIVILYTFKCIIQFLGKK